VWKVSGNGSSVTGRIRLNVHYFEDGNVQLQTDTNKTIQGSSDAKVIVESIKKVEQEFEMELEASYNALGTNTFKALRRALPMTANKINWNSIKAYSLAKDMK
jgi:capping protein alpha